MESVRFLVRPRSVRPHCDHICPGGAPPAARSALAAVFTESAVYRVSHEVADDTRLMSVFGGTPPRFLGRQPVGRSRPQDTGVADPGPQPYPTTASRSAQLDSQQVSIRAGIPNPPATLGERLQSRLDHGHEDQHSRGTRCPQ